jgi:glutaminyl-peptide cyclotransferase
VPNSNRWPWLLPALALLLATLAGCRPNEKEAPPTVDGASALKLAGQLVAFGKRCSGTEAYRKQSEFIAEEARAAGANVLFQDFRKQTAKGGILFRNIIAEVKGREDRFVIVSTHCDLKDLGELAFEGANDGASGTALLLEMMRALERGGRKLPVTVRFVFFDGEECMIAYSESDGLFGSRHYAQSMNAADRKACLGVINVDMVGDRDLLVTVPRNGDDGLAGQVLAAAGAAGYGAYFVRSAQVVLDDHVPFLEQGIPAVNLIDFDYGPANSYWHTDADSMDKISAESLEIVGNTVFRAIWHIKK